MGREIYKTKLQEEAFRILGDPIEITSKKIIELFAYTKDGAKFGSDDIIMIGPEQSPFVKDGTLTTLGIFIANKVIFEDMQIFGYINKTLNGATIKAIQSKIPQAIMEGDITQQQVFDYIDRTQWLFGGTLAHLINTSISSTLVNLPDDAKKLRTKLFKENKEALERGEPQISADVEKQITKTALDTMRKNNDPALALFDSGCGIDPHNNYKTMFVMKGAIVDNTGESPTGYKTVTSNYDDGVSQEDMPKIADSLVTGAYSRGVSTQVAGYSGIKYNAVFQRVRFGPRGSDCGTKRTESVLVTKDNMKELGQYHFIMVNGKPVMLTPDNVSAYLGKTVELRSPIYCEYDDPMYCNTCCGDRSYRIGIKNAGLALNIAAGALLNQSLKKFHDVTIKTSAIDVDSIMKYSDYAR